MVSSRQSHRSSLLVILGIFIILVVAVNLMYLPSVVVVLPVDDFSSAANAIAEFPKSNHELSYTQRHPASASLAPSSSFSVEKTAEGTKVINSGTDVRKESAVNDSGVESHAITTKKDKEEDFFKNGGVSRETKNEDEANLVKEPAVGKNKLLNSNDRNDSMNYDEITDDTGVKPSADLFAETKQSSIAGLNCDKFGGPDKSAAAEMVYWRDIPNDSHFTSPYAYYGEAPKYLTFEPDEGGWNNIRMSMETATALAHAMGRILVLPFEQNIYLLGNDRKKENNRFTFKKFFPFDLISQEHKAVEVITMEEFLQREVMTGNIRNDDGVSQYPPGNRTNFEGHIRDGKKFWIWLRSVALASKWNFSTCPVVFPKVPGKVAADEMEKLYKTMNMKKQNHQTVETFYDKPTPVDGNVTDRLQEMLSFRKNICLYTDEMQKSKVMHFMGDNNSGARLLTHFYSFIFFESWRQDLWTKRYVRDHLRYIDEIQCAAARIVQAVRQKAIEYGNPDGEFNSMHVRRGDFQYKQTRIPATEIYDNIRDVFVENSTVFIATDERRKGFFEPLLRHWNVLYLDNFLHLIPDLNKNYYGMLDQRIASKGIAFAGAYYSTFTGYINRMRGYHSQKDKLPGHEKGKLNSYFYVEKQHKEEMIHYYPLKGPLWAREFPVSWRNIDHDLDESHIISR